MRNMNASGVILAGGKSSRMRFNKAFAQISSRPVIEIIIDKFNTVFDETIIISNEPDLYRHFGLKVYTDIYPRLGPISGIHSGLVNAMNDVIFVVGCDMPFINMELVQYMLDQLGDHETVVPSIDSNLQPISAVYSRKCIPLLADCLENDKLKLTLIFKELDAVIINEDILEKFGKIREIFYNVNDLNALEAARQIAGRL